MPRAGALAYALWLLERRLRTEHELREKLLLHKYEQSEISEVIAKLKEKKLIDDEQYARHYVLDKSEFARRGRYRISLELKKKGISKEVIDKAVAEIDPDVELEAARSLLKGKERLWGEMDPQKKYQKAMGLLSRRGFSVGMIKEVTKNWARSDN